MGYTKRNNDGGAASEKQIEALATRDERANTIRKQKAAARRARAKSGNGGVTQTLFDSVWQDRRERRDEAIAHRETQMQAQYEHQAAMALASPAITNLREGSVVRTYAETIIGFYADARPYGGKKKTAVAVEQATSLLGEAWLKQSKGADQGRSAAYRAIKGAYIKQTTPAMV